MLEAETALADLAAEALLREEDLEKCQEEGHAQAQEALSLVRG